jgi:hypothetical protein
MNEVTRCAHCGEVIGVYEPLVALVDGRASESSLVAEPACDRDADACFHRECFLELGEDAEGDA